MRHETYTSTPNRLVVINYTNHKGETSDRKILPQKFYFDSTKWHPEPQWLLDAFDLDKQVPRTFAVKDIHSWTPVSA
jgi:predicted DNA-binding transcriptional regulator YafY